MLLWCPFASDLIHMPDVAVAAAVASAVCTFMMAKQRQSLIEFLSLVCLFSFISVRPHRRETDKQFQFFKCLFLLFTLRRDVFLFSSTNRHGILKKKKCVFRSVGNDYDLGPIVWCLSPEQKKILWKYILMGQIKNRKYCETARNKMQTLFDSKLTV